MTARLGVEALTSGRMPRHFYDDGRRLFELESSIKASQG